MKFGKIVDGKMTYKRYSMPIVVDGVSYITKDVNLNLQAGYKELVYTSPSPDEGYRAVAFNWVENDTQYIQTWTYELIPEEVYEPSLEERLEAVESALFEIIDMLVGGDA